MFIPDVNILIQVFRPGMPEHDRCRRWLELRAEEGSLALNSVVMSGMIRIVTNPRVFEHPDPVEKAVEFCEALLALPDVLQIHPETRHWELFARLCRETGASGNLIPDAWFAALAIEHHATWVTLDKDFKRFPGLRITAP